MGSKASPSGNRPRERAASHPVTTSGEKAQVLAVTEEDAVFIVSINRSYPDFDVYDAARYAWRISPRRARDIRYVLATKDRRVVGVFEPSGWKPATKDNFPEFEKQMPGRIGFVGRPAGPAAMSRYLGRELPREFRFSGNGYRYAGKLSTHPAPAARRRSEG